jgi:nitroreductase
MTEPTPLQKLIRRRRSIRRWLPKPVEREKIEACLEAARLAPSASNVQPWRFLVVDDPEVKAAFADAAFSGIWSATKFAAEAPVFVLILAEHGFLAHQVGKQVQGVSFFLLDLGIAGEHLVLQAEELGLGTCWIGWFNNRAARKFFKIPRRYKLVSIIALGYNEKRPPRDRILKPRDEVVWFNRFGG